MANYDHVNAAWPENAPRPSAQEAIAGARKLIKLALTLGPEGKTHNIPMPKRFKATSGRRHTWPRNGVWYINPDRQGWGFGGWKEIVHAISHRYARRLYPNAKPHDHQHAFMERTLAEHVVRSGWLEGKLKREPKAKPPIDVKAERHKNVLDKIAAWERKAKRAKTALRKLERSRKYYERQQAV